MTNNSNFTTNGTDDSTEAGGIVDTDFSEDSPSPSEFDLGDKYTLLGVFVDDTPSLKGRSLIGRDQKGKKFLVAFEEDLDLESELSNLLGDKNRLLRITNVKYAREGEPLRFKATKETEVFDPQLGENSSLLISAQSSESDAQKGLEAETSSSSTNIENGDTPSHPENRRIQIVISLTHPKPPSRHLHQ